MTKIGIKSYAESLKQAAELEKIAQEISTLRSQVRTTRTESDSNWKGKSGNAFRQAIESDEKRLQKLEDNVRKNATAIRAVVKELQEAQEQNSKAARKVNSVG